MLIVKIQGGLGNQMFQYAAGLSLADKRRDDLVIDVSSFMHDPIRSFRLDLFPGVARRLASGDVSVLGPTTRVPTPVRVVRDDFRTFSFPEGDLYLDGYWQSERFFADIADKIIGDFDLSHLSARVPADAHRCAALHVRRGDYLRSNGYHPVLGADYYRGALSLLDDFDGVKVFSDDPDWCAQGLGVEGAQVVAGNDEITDLGIMSRCRHNVIANSSFSWWAAWLNRTPGRMVVAPTKWFGPTAGLNTDNMVPSGWHVL